MVSCSNTDEPAVLDSVNPSENIDSNEEEKLGVKPVIDTNDLSHLPTDTGGSHTAFPVGKTKAEGTGYKQ